MPISSPVGFSDAVKSGRAMNRAQLVGTCAMATKRTKADKAQQQADQLDKKSERRFEQEKRKKISKDSSRAA